MWAGAVWNVEFVVYGGLAVVVFGLSFAQAVVIILIGNLFYVLTGLASLQGPRAGTTTFAILAGTVVRDLPGGLAAAAEPVRRRGAAQRARRALLPQRRGAPAGDRRAGGRHGGGGPVGERLLAVPVAPVQPGRRGGLQRGLVAVLWPASLPGARAPRRS